MNRVMIKYTRSFALSLEMAWPAQHLTENRHHASAEAELAGGVALEERETLEEREKSEEPAEDDRDDVE